MRKSAFCALQERINELNRKSLLLIMLLATGLILVGCGPSAEQADPKPPVEQVDPEPKPDPDLTSRPQVWFAPLPPLKILPSRPFTGSDDYMKLFTPDAPWQEAAGHVHVFKLYGEWVDPWAALHASVAELQQALADLEHRGFAIAVEMGPLEPGPDGGQGLESESRP